MIKLNLLFPLGALAVLAFGTAIAQPAPVATERVQKLSATVAKVDAKGPAGFVTDLALLENRFEFQRWLKTAARTSQPAS